MLGSKIRKESPYGPSERTLRCRQGKACGLLWVPGAVTRGTVSTRCWATASLSALSPLFPSDPLPPSVPPHLGLQSPKSIFIYQEQLADVLMGTKLTPVPAAINDELKDPFIFFLNYISGKELCLAVVFCIR